MHFVPRSIHPTLDVLVTAGRDATARVCAGNALPSRPSQP